MDSQIDLFCFIWGDLGLRHMAGAHKHLSKFSSWPMRTLPTLCFLNESWMWPRQGPLKSNADSWKSVHQGFISKKLHYWPELQIMGVLYLPVRNCLFNTVKTEDKADLGKLLSFYIYIYIHTHLFGFSAFLSLSIRRWDRGRSTYTASNETAEVTRDSKIIKFHGTRTCSSGR